jgi:hypothetical protein
MERERFRQAMNIRLVVDKTRADSRQVWCQDK